MLAFVPQSTAAVAPCYHPPVQKAHMRGASCIHRVCIFALTQH